ncbi:DNA-binding transcriptional regulator [Glaesserella parasuis]|uniref:helix-turn-helix domain-containing protein n=1 Tax=Glaesserella parasuis TaxID=738 RepID=UPI000479D98E|nr:DNA-binding transcriptional regulator [Glaesserella parasuis]KEZ22887.1 putative transcriptional regulator [Glaesserella parasuis]MDE3956749.1 DNA-binding transcriptional regulator [Glaesserella parasuis]MDE3958960.1 DNA-binding transcriptional regulator [Glaesserella parasuis]MDE3968120.1 DNA-binding transcriptional regulator [Glaesserella parasuis]MDE3970335.1 DNA-binding transcriptional regulator [Glaesserella parasuis]
MSQYNSPANAAIHELMSDLHDVGLVDKTTMRSFDKRCLTPVKTLAPNEIREIREKENFSQAVFAHYLNVSSNLVSEWERGVKKPSGAALKLLSLVQHKGISAIA